MRFFSKKIQNVVIDLVGRPDGVTERYIYTNKRNYIPNFLRRMLGMKEVRPDRRKRRYGRIQAHLFYYITFPMIIITSGLLYVVSTNLPLLFVYFNTNLYLNGMIISFMIFGILRVYYNCFLFFQTASFLRQLENTAGKDKIDDSDIYKLRQALEGKGALVNISAMDEVIKHVEEFHFLKITDNQARFIKSKLGFRAAGNRKNVNFISGILVMLGLLGTFLGLLSTIDAVGQALNSMANIGGESGEIGMEEMTSFIGSLAAPLQGMGLAFSSSLFGLSGSLIIGFFLHLASTPQNEFIENVSRWIDDRIQKFDPKKLAKKADPKDKEAKAMPPAVDENLKDWLNGYIYLSTETHKRLDGLTDKMAIMSEDLQSVSDNINALALKESDLERSILTLSENFQDITEYARGIKVSMDDIQYLSQGMSTSLNSIGSSNSKLADSVGDIAETTQKIDSSIDKNAQVATDIREHLPSIKATIIKSNDNQIKYTNALYKELKGLHSFQKEHGQILAKTVPASVEQLKAYIDGIERALEDSKAMSADEHVKHIEKLQDIERHILSLDQKGYDIAQKLNAPTESHLSTTYSIPSKKSFAFWKRR